MGVNKIGLVPLLLWVLLLLPDRCQQVGAAVVVGVNMIGWVLLLLWVLRLSPERCQRDWVGAAAVEGAAAVVPLLFMIVLLLLLVLHSYFLFLYHCYSQSVRPRIGAQNSGLEVRYCDCYYFLKKQLFLFFYYCTTIFCFFYC